VNEESEGVLGHKEATKGEADVVRMARGKRIGTKNKGKRLRPEGGRGRLNRERGVHSWSMKGRKGGGLENIISRAKSGEKHLGVGKAFKRKRDLGHV